MTVVVVSMVGVIIVLMASLLGSLMHIRSFRQNSVWRDLWWLVCQEVLTPSGQQLFHFIHFGGLNLNHLFSQLNQWLLAAAFDLVLSHSDGSFVMHMHQLQKLGVSFGPVKSFQLIQLCRGQHPVGHMFCVMSH